ncbi:hypothetical protein SPSYN_02625 [Sporotomaculum syntrophicum]|uniref:DUF1538 domain-containing protein n=1 Tax=Sporotomaculum syntrophicum TaxID=182264 RepID=A0A9D3AXA9_9FIRM|nr:DUF1538 domain-containing protein [Sporotomaculum syntrophicum]KAF1084221.1 hypothetical protein SPSYN_02625 [Sporotomaculum syntrophicum]
MNDLIVFSGYFNVIQEVAIALTPLLVIMFVFQFVLRLPWDEVKRILIGIFISFIGLSLFLQGVKIGFMPAGTSLGVYIGQLDYNWIAIPIGLLLGLVIVIAEPSVWVLNHEVEQVSSGYINQRTMMLTLSIGVAISVALAMARIVYGIPLMYILIPGYAIALIMTHFVSPTFVSLAFDSGGVASGTMTVTFVLAMTVGIATGIEGRDPLLDGFGVVGLVALTPILSVLLLGIVFGGEKVENEDSSGA